MTFLFTDIEGSTRLWETARDEMAAALQQHDTLLRAAIDRHGGYGFSTGGDGFAAAFAWADAAVRAALDYFGPTVNRKATRAALDDLAPTERDRLLREGAALDRKGLMALLREIEAAAA